MNSANTVTMNQYETEAAEAEGAWHINRAREIADGLQDFSTQLKAWREEDIKNKQQKGKLLARKHKQVDAQRLIEIEAALQDTTLKEFQIQKLKEEQLKLHGVDVYPEASRIEHLSPHAQVGYVSEKLRIAGNIIPEHLNHYMQNSDQKMTVNGITFSPKKLREHNIQGVAFKEAALQYGLSEIEEKMGINRFSPEILELSGYNKARQTAVDTLNQKFRERYNIDASMKTRAQGDLAWHTGKKTGFDLYMWHLKTRNTVSDKNVLLKNQGAWTHIMGHLTKQGVALGNSNYADYIGELEIPDAWAKELGIKPGKKFKDHWPEKVKDLRANIDKGLADIVDAALDANEDKANKLTLLIKKRIFDDPDSITQQQIFAWEEEYRKIGEPMPKELKDWPTLNERNAARDKVRIQQMIDSQNGFYTTQDLAPYHPSAAQEFRKEALRLEQAKTNELDGKGVIQTELNTVWTDMGKKNNEKTPEYTNALNNANRDYERKLWKYYNSGHSIERAHDLALYGTKGEAKNLQTQESFMEEGVITHIENLQAKNKYVREGILTKAETSAAREMENAIGVAKKELFIDKNIVESQVIGGAYGRSMLTQIMQNMKYAGPRRGLQMSTEAINYYKGIMRGRNIKLEGGYWGLIDKQLKAIGHPGLTGSEIRPPVVDLSQRFYHSEYNPWTDEENGSLGYEALVSDVLSAYSQESLEGYLDGTFMLQEAYDFDLGESWFRTDEALLYGGS